MLKCKNPIEAQSRLCHLTRLTLRISPETRLTRAILSPSFLPNNSELKTSTLCHTAVVEYAKFMTDDPKRSLKQHPRGKRGQSD